PLVSEDTLAMALSKGAPSGLAPVPALAVEARAADGPAVLQAALKAAKNVARSPLRQALLKRTARPPLEVAALLAAKYPQSPGISYIPAVAWAGALRLARLRPEAPESAGLRDRVRQAAAPYLVGTKAPIEGAPDVAKLSGYLLFAELAEDQQ